MKQKLPVLLALILLFAVSFTVTATPAAAAPEYRLSKGQTVYVPVYSNVFSGPRKRPFQLAATLSVRNTDPAGSLKITAIDYYDTNGKLVRRYRTGALSLGPLASADFHIDEKDVAGGFGANFIVRWEADRAINAPIIECVMIGTASGQGISFVSPGQEIKE
ncbi:hypothetical protein GMST_14420 [Geomonas silvestris]|uniref:DUF3124 domain-containing protein n=1 Tax=Geomonas silvestris TaxID=2740184 RepID=A0A6V8MGM7_9BACT|nr:DUF3124 domain-containing protein [Geomonas silvestris]GFO59117.1 hypothetical protein GMST_14420 [Geomonas silvestris]